MMKRKRETASLPKQIVVFCMGGMCGWSAETEFDEIPGRGYSITCYTDGARLRRQPGGGVEPLDWKAVYKAAGRIGTMRLWGDFRSEVVIHGVEGWQRDLIVAKMLQSCPVDLSPLRDYLSVFPEADLQELHTRYGSLLSNAALEAAGRVVKALEGKKRRPRNLDALRRYAGCGAGAGLEEIAEALEDRLHPASAIAKRGSALMRFLEAFQPLHGGGPMGPANPGHQLLKILGGAAEAIYAHLQQNGEARLGELTLRFLAETRQHVNFFHRMPTSGFNVNVYGRAFHGPLADAAQQVDAAARAAGIAIPAELQVGEIPHRRVGRAFLLTGEPGPEGERELNERTKALAAFLDEQVRRERAEEGA